MQLTGRFDISVGLSRKETKWKQENVDWENFIGKLAEPHRTRETHREFMAAAKSRQDEIKDVGGFVGGIIKGGNRLASNVVSRQLVTLDLDYAPKDFWQRFKMIYGCAACIYSTHKHSPAAPRLRLLMPLDRPVFPDEYQAIGRRIAGNLGIEFFDHTTFQPERLMYWPSCSVDSEYVYEVQAGEWLDADSVLASYYDWRDVSQWPLSKRFTDLVLKNNAKLGNPLDKPGIVGAFCRTYGMSEAIEKFLPDVYEKMDENRFTFLGGSTAGGLVLYDDLYAFSHHGTDPASGRGVNAFDLVRLHRFPHVDEDVLPSTPINKFPSHGMMADFASQDKEVKRTMGMERLEGAKEAFNGAGTSTLSGEPERVLAPPNFDWLTDLKTDKKGNYFNSSENVLIILRNDPNLKGKFGWDLFTNRGMVWKSLPWRELETETGAASQLRNIDGPGLRTYLERVYGLSSATKIKDAFDMLLNENSFHPVREYLESVKWDGAERVDRLLIDFLGAEDSEYIRAVTRKTLVAAVARVYNPGIKFDYVLSLVGPEGRGKSTFIERLAGRWFSDSFDFAMIGTKESFEQLQGSWIIEIGEMKGLRTADVDSVKHYISKRVDRFRVAYGTEVEDFPRQNIFIGTGNNLDFLKSPNGDRRFWPAQIAKVDPIADVFTGLTPRVVGLIWAEAYRMYVMGESLHLDKPMELAALAMQREHSEQDERKGSIRLYLDTVVPHNWPAMSIAERRNYFFDWRDFSDEERKEKTVDGFIRDRITAAEIWCEWAGKNKGEMTRHNTKDYHELMRNMEGWQVKHSKIPSEVYGMLKGYERIK